MIPETRYVWTSRRVCDAEVGAEAIRPQNRSNPSVRERKGGRALVGRVFNLWPAQGAPAIGRMPALYKRRQAGYKPAAG